MRASTEPLCSRLRLSVAVEQNTPALRGKCLIQKTVLLLQQQQHAKALESAQAVLTILPDCKHAMALLATSLHKTGKKKDSAAMLVHLNDAFLKTEDSQMSEDFGHPLELTTALLVEMHRTKEALKLLGALLVRVTSPRHQQTFFAIARLYAKHGLNKDALVSKLPSLCSMPPDRRTWELLKSMAEVVLPIRPSRLACPSSLACACDQRAPFVCRRSARLLLSSKSYRSTSTRPARATSRMCPRSPRSCANCLLERTAVPQAKRCSFSSSVPLRFAHARLPWS